MHGAGAPTEEHQVEESQSGILTFPARILVQDETRASTDDLLSLAKTRALDPTIFEEYTPIFWSSLISNNTLDAYGTRMMPSSLKNYASEAEEGVSFQDSHRSDGMARTFGQSIGGRYVGSGGNGVARTTADFYTLQGMDPAIDDFIRKMRAGITRDNSIGAKFLADSVVRCSICGRDMRRDWDCWHMPLVEYEVTDKKGQPTGERKMAEGQMENMHLSEVSAVYDGATQSAGYLSMKVTREIAAGRMRPETVDFLEQRYRMVLPRPTRAFAGAEVPPPAKEAEPMEFTPEQIAAIRLALTETGAAPDADPAVAVRAVVDELMASRGLSAEVERLKPFEAEVTTLRPLADEGRAYRADLVTNALAEGARAYGKDFAESTYRALLEAAPLETVKRMHEDWSKAGDGLFPGGRKTQETTEPTPIARKRRPAAAYS